MRSRSCAAVGLTAAVTAFLLVWPPARAAALGPPLTAPPAPVPWRTVVPAAEPPPWFVVAGVAVAGLVAVLAVVAGAIRNRRLTQELRWATQQAEVETAETAHVLRDVPDGLVPGFEVDLDGVPELPPASRAWVSPMTELAVPTTVRALTSPDLDTDALIEAMSSRLPERGMAAVRLGERFHLAGSTARLIDRRILATAAELLEADVAEPLVAWLARFGQVRDAAIRTLDDPEQPEIIETLVPPEPFTVTHGLTVVVDVDQEPVARIRFCLDVTTTVGETALVVRRGEIPELVCRELSVAATLTLVRWSTPLWCSEPARVADVHLAPRPPVLVPLVASTPLPESAAPEEEPTRRGGLPPLPPPPRQVGSDDRAKAG